MGLSAKEYKATLGEKEAFLVRSLAEERKTIFDIHDASRLLGPGAKKAVHRLALKKWVLPLKRGLYVIVPLDVGVQVPWPLAYIEANICDFWYDRRNWGDFSLGIDAIRLGASTRPPSTSPDDVSILSIGYLIEENFAE